jgi:hypothetical protein
MPVGDSAGDRAQGRNGTHRNGRPSGPDTAVLRAALAAIERGLSVLLIKPFAGTGEGKEPAVGSWKPYQSVAAGRGQVEAWFSGHPERGLAVVGGYGDLEVLDFDVAEVFERYVEAAEAAGAGELLRRVSAGYLERTPKGGAHALYFCPGAVEGNQKLAQRPEVDERGVPVLDERGRQKVKTLIETRGSGGYAVVAPSPGAVHKIGKPYVLASGGFGSIAAITPDERRVLFALAALFDECPEPPRREPTGRSSANGAGATEHGQRPGDLYNAAATADVWKELLPPHGWTLTRESSGRQYWLRPGGEKTCSAVAGGTKNVFVCFSSNGHPFRAWSASDPVSYTPFAAFCVLHHGSDCDEAYRAGAKELARRGFASRTSANGDPRQWNSPPPADRPPAESTSATASKFASPATSTAIILDYLRATYQPVYRDGRAIRCRDGSTVMMSVACAVPTSALIERLSAASDAPRYAEAAGGGVKRAALPGHFKKWAPVAWGDLLATLPDEDGAELGDLAEPAEEFRRLVRAALLEQVTLGVTIGDKGSIKQEQFERRSFIEWCKKFAKPGPWRAVRSFKLFSKLKDHGGGEIELKVAIQYEFLAQVRADRRLTEMGATKFGRRARRYCVADDADDNRVHGERAVVLRPEFVSELLEDVCDPLPESAASL